MKPITIDYLRERSDEVGDCWIWKRAVGKAGYPIMSRRSGGDGLVRRVCARKAGLIEPKRRGRASEAERDSRARDLFDGVTT